MPDEQICFECGAEIISDAQGGLCVRCLLSLGRIAVGKIKVLVVDDETSFTRLLKATLEVTGKFEVRVENRAEGACGAARAFQPHIIFLNIGLSRLPGGSVGEQLAADPDLREIPIVLLITKLIRVQERQLPDGRIMYKPASAGNVVEMIRRHARTEKP